MPDAAGPQHANTEHPHPKFGGTAQALDQPPMCSFRYPCLVTFGAVPSQAIEHARSRLRQARRSQRQCWDPQPFAPELAQLKPVSGGMEDVDAIIALGGSAPPADSGASGAEGAEVELAWSAHGAGASEREGEVLGELVALQAVAAPRPRRYEQRSWELMAQASQRIRAHHPQLLAGVRSSLSKVGVQVIAQAGMLRDYRRPGPGPSSAALVTEIAREPVVSRSMLLETQSADDILEAVLHALPLDIEDQGCMQTAAASCDHLLLTFCVDRASANMRALSWIVEVLERPGMPPNVFPHVEPCAAHGAALVKARARGDHDGIVKASHSLAALMRQARGLATLRDSVLQLVGRHLVVRRERRPTEVVDRCSRLAVLLYGASDSEHLWVTSRAGEQRKGQRLTDLEALSRMPSTWAQPIAAR